MNAQERGRRAPVHQPVMVREVLRHLDLRPGLTVVDGTVGAGGHSRKILEQISDTGRLVGLDRDPMMLEWASKAVSGPNVTLRHASYAELSEVLQELGIAQVDRILLDLGLSSDQLADAERGFSFDAAGPLDLRFDPTRGEPAWKRLEEYDEDELTDILDRYGEERFSRAIAREIIGRRTANPVRTANDLAAAVETAVPGKFQREARKHPATRVFQALRIAVNDELNHLQTALQTTLHHSLAPGGRLVIITFHSLEDRLVKDEFRSADRWQNLTSKPVPASAAEQRINPRSRTAKLRAAIRKSPN